MDEIKELAEDIAKSCDEVKASNKKDKFNCAGIRCPACTAEKLFEKGWRKPAHSEKLVEEIAVWLFDYIQNYTPKSRSEIREDAARSLASLLPEMKLIGDAEREFAKYVDNDHILHLKPYNSEYWHTHLAFPYVKKLDLKDGDLVEIIVKKVSAEEVQAQLAADRKE